MVAHSGIIYAISSPTAANYYRAAGDNANFTLREITLQDAANTPLPSSRGNSLFRNFLHYSRVNETIVSTLHSVVFGRLVGFLRRDFLTSIEIPH